MDRKQESVLTGLPSFASGTLNCLNPGLICSFVQQPRKTSETTLLSRPSSATEDGESNEEEEKSTTSSDKSEQDSESDRTTEDEEETNTTETHQIHNVLNKTIHDGRKFIRS